MIPAALGMGALALVAVGILGLSGLAQAAELALHNQRQRAVAHGVASAAVTVLAFAGACVLFGECVAAMMP